MIKVICHIMGVEYLSSEIKIKVKVISCLESLIMNSYISITDMSLSEDAIKAAIRSATATDIVTYASENGLTITVSESEVRII